MRLFRRKWEKSIASRPNDADSSLPADLKLRLARLVVDALEVGTGKRERDVIDELFEAFGLDFAALDRQVSPKTVDRATVLRALAANELARAAPGEAALLQEVLRRGSRFAAMLDEVYARLAKHGVTTLVAAEVIRVGREEVRIDLDISEAFLERVRELQQVLQSVAFGVVNESAIGRFIGLDGGECYGSWPLDDSKTGNRLADAIQNLGWISERALGTTQTGSDLRTALAEAAGAADRLCSIAEGLVQSHIRHLEWLERMSSESHSLSDDEIRRRLFSDAARSSLFPFFRWDAELGDVQSYRRFRALGMTVPSDFVSGLDEDTFLGVDGDLRYMSFPSKGWMSGSGMAKLATFLAMRRLGIYSTRRREELETELFQSPERLAEWLDTVRTGCLEVARWLSEDVVTWSGTRTISGEIENIQEFLNLPLWRARDLLYEIWVLCATLAACEEAGWDVQLRELDGDVWTLTVGGTQRPVASLSRREQPELHLDVWREPTRVDQQGVLTPDVTISTSAPIVRDLVVVEAKDRMKMSSGSAQTGRQQEGGKRTAAAVALKYAEGLGPSVTWVCNHCDYRHPVDPSQNQGNPWYRIHIAGSFRPGMVPDDFATSIACAIYPPVPARTDEGRAGLMLVIDWTISFRRGRADALQRLAECEVGDGVAVRAVLFADHGEYEPFLVRKLGPIDSIVEAVQLIATVPPGRGGDPPEALEDALSRCREIVADVGRQDVLILTDAPPHSAEECAYGIDYRQEIRGILDAGCRVLVADDWGAGVHREDLSDVAPQELLDRFIREPLAAILARVAERAAERPSRA